MSSGPTGTKPVKFKNYYHLQLEKKDWCNYLKECPMENNIGECYCWICKHHNKLDIPNLLAERGQNANNLRTAVSNTK